jgi:hypothetical protein
MKSQFLKEKFYIFNVQYMSFSTFSKVSIDRLTPSQANYEIRIIEKRNQSYLLLYNIMWHKVRKVKPGDDAMKMVRSLTADGPLADDADEVEADVNESTAENFLFAWKWKCYRFV